MAICKFWQRGNCRNGDACRFEHPGYQKPVQNSGNRFAALQAPQNQARGQPNERLNVVPYALSKDAIVKDLSTERPQWILSAYGPGLRAPAQLFGGPLREQSFEEMRLHHYVGLASGNAVQVVQEAEALVRTAEQQMQNALQDVDGAIRFIINAENEHPNRIDICNGSSTPTQQQTPFGAPPAASNTFATAQPVNPFGQPAAPSQGPNPFGQATSSVAPGASGAFGRPSSLGQRPDPFAAAPASGNAIIAGGGFAAFGAAPNPFGRPPAQPANPNPFGAPTQQVTANSFGTPAQDTPSNAFGASAPPNMPSQFGAQNQATTPNPFGAPAQPAVSNPFGQAPQPASVNPFGAPAQSVTSNSFATSTPQAAPNPFGAASQPSQPIQANAFGAPSQASQPNSFGVPSQPSQPNPFGAPQQSQTSPFANPPNAPGTANPFGHTPANQPNPFGQQSPAAATTNPFGGPAQQPAVLTNGGTSGPAPTQDYVASRDGNGRLTSFHGRPIMYKNGEAGMRAGDGTWEKIWFPDGPPPHDKNTEMDEELYDDIVKAAYIHVRETGSFKDGIMPLIPPKRDWCLWNF